MLKAAQQEAIDYLESLGRKAIDPHFDRVTPFILAQNEHINYLFPLKEVITLVWLALTDDCKYHAYIEAEGQIVNEETSKAHRQDRISYFFSCIITMNNNRVCHHGSRNELVFTLNKSYPDIDLIEDEKATVFYFIKENLIKAFSEQYSDEKIQFELKQAMLIWINDQNPTVLFNLVGENFIAELSTLFLKNGTRPEEINLKNLMQEAISSLDFSCDPVSHPGLYYISLVFQHFNIKQEKADAVLKQIQEWISHKMDLSNPSHVERLGVFCLLFKTYQLIMDQQYLLRITGILEAALPAFISFIENYFDQIFIEKDLIHSELTLDQEKEISLIESQIDLAKKDLMVHEIQNFFSIWFTGEHSARKSQYQLLLNTQFQNKVLINDSWIDELYNQKIDGQLELSPYEINRIFLHAIITPPGNWSNNFGGSLKLTSSELVGGVLQQTLEFVKQHFNNNQTFIANSIKSSSYPNSLLEQLTWLLEKHRRNLWAELSEDEQLVRAPLNIEDDLDRIDFEIFLPNQIRTGRDWLRLFSLLNQENFRAVYLAFKVNINFILLNHIKRYNDLLLTYFWTIPADEKFNFSLDLVNYKLIKNIAQLNNILLDVNNDQRMILIERLNDDLTSIEPSSCDDEPYLSTILWGLPNNIQRQIIKKLSHRLVDFCDSVEGLHRILLTLNEEEEILFINSLGKNIRELFKVSNHLHYLYRLSSSSKFLILHNLSDMVTASIDNLLEASRLNVFWSFIEPILNKIAPLIQSSRDLSSILDLYITEEQKITLLNTLFIDFSKIITKSADFFNIFQKIPKAYITTFLNHFDNKGANFIRNTADFFNIWKKIPNEYTATFFDHFKNKAANFIRSIDDLVIILKEITEADQLIILNNINFHKIIYQDNCFPYLLNAISPNNWPIFLASIRIDQQTHHLMGTYFTATFFDSLFAKVSVENYKLLIDSLGDEQLTEIIQLYRMTKWRNNYKRSAIIDAIGPRLGLIVKSIDVLIDLPELLFPYLDFFIDSIRMDCRIFFKISELEPKYRIEFVERYGYKIITESSNDHLFNTVISLLPDDYITTYFLSLGENLIPILQNHWAAWEQWESSIANQYLNYLPEYNNVTFLVKIYYLIKYLIHELKSENSENFKITLLETICVWLENKNNFNGATKEKLLILIRDICALKRGYFGLFLPTVMNNFTTALVTYEMKNELDISVLSTIPENSNEKFLKNLTVADLDNLLLPNTNTLEVSYG